MKKTLTLVLGIISFGALAGNSIEIRVQGVIMPEMNNNFIYDSENKNLNRIDESKMEKIQTTIVNKQSKDGLVFIDEKSTLKIYKDKEVMPSGKEYSKFTFYY